MLSAGQASEATQAKTRAPSLRIEIDDDGDRVSINHPDKRLGLIALMEAMGTTDANFFHSLIGQFLDATSKHGRPVADDVNFILSVVKGMEPRDQTEAMLAAQMAVVHLQAMTFARKLAEARYIEQQDSAGRAFNKLTRTLTMQLDALKKYRTGGEQKVTVKLVTVNEGGQAIVGNIETGGRGDKKRRR